MDNSPRSNTMPSHKSVTLRVFGLLLVLVAGVYSNSLDAIWTLDDDPNILQNSRLHIADLLPETLFQTFFSPLHPDADGQPGLNRPLAHLSFALNWYFGQDAPAGYRLVNICIHFLTAFVLFAVIRVLLQAPNLRGAYAGRADLIALLGAVLWALNPIQTQAVVYIVQRMASLACFFYLLGIWCYLQGRTAGRRSHRLRWLILTLVCFLAAVGSKENAILLPAALVLLEFSFFQDVSHPAVRRRLRYVLVSGLGVVVFAAGWLFWQAQQGALPGYSIRLFSPGERLMTEPRIVLFYLSQMFYPVPGRLSIVHDVELSRSLLEPWTTLPAIFAVAGLIGLGVWQLRGRPMLGFAILFFFLNHVVESSIIGLELIYEHRNYLPSLFVFVPVAMGLGWLIDHYRLKRQRFQYVIVGFVVLLTAGLGLSTYVRNLAWSDPKTFWEDAARKAPLSMRPVHNLAYYHYEKHGHYEAAFELYQRELDLKGYTRWELSSAHVNLANHYFRRGDLDRASEHLNMALANFPGFEPAQYRLAFVWFRSGEFQKALDTLQPLVARRPAAFDYNYLMAQIALKMDRQAEAWQYLQRCLRLAPSSSKALEMMGIALNRYGHFQRAEWFFSVALDRSPGDKRTLLWLVECQLQRGDEHAAAKSAADFLEGLPLDRIQGAIRKAFDDTFMSESAKERVGRWVWQQVHQQTSQSLNGLRSERPIFTGSTWYDA